MGVNSEGSGENIISTYELTAASRSVLVLFSRSRDGIPQCPMDQCPRPFVSDVADTVRVECQNGCGVTTAFIYPSNME